jgi:hypothetical protein
MSLSLSPSLFLSFSLSLSLAFSLPPPLREQVLKNIENYQVSFKSSFFF